MRSFNASTLQQALDYLARAIQWRIQSCFNPSQPSSVSNFSGLSSDWLAIDSPLSQFIQAHQLNSSEQLVLLTALAPHLQPDFFDQWITAQLPQAGDYPQLGGWRGTIHRGFLPTGETALFLLGGLEFTDRFPYYTLFSQEHLFSQQQILYLDPVPNGEPRMSGKLIMTQDYVDWFSQGSFSSPQFSVNFPAQRITTEMDWDDLVLNSQTLDKIHDLKVWIDHGATLLYDWEMKKKLKLGYRVLFYGPPGTGKTLTASLLGKYTGRDVYKVDLSMVVSKFIGETEKNLANLFARAESKGWILFFDEADALFGKRTNVRDAHDKYANQEVSYLLQRVEHYDGLVILSSNLKSNIDDAFIRRFQSIINFPMPNSKERLQIWKKAFPSQLKLGASVDLTELSISYELSGADIMNIVQYCCLQVLKHGHQELHKKTVLAAIKREFSKAGKIV
ncbi:MAG: ATP-binding protein [Cyanobacteria bacterium P01_F01_bin.150]